MTVGNISKTEGNPFARGHAKVDDSDPLFTPYFDSLESGEPLHVETDEPKKVIGKLRRIAQENGLGVRVKEGNNGVFFRAKQKRANNSKNDEDE